VDRKAGPSTEGDPPQSTIQAPILAPRHSTV
jgi:hypothetical protein